VLKVVLEVKDLYFSFEDRFILHGINFELDRGELCGLFGPNGSGKTSKAKN
jgi:ABC-type Mn2+/Zn2+ transport system ATPase subunit